MKITFSYLHASNRKLCRAWVRGYSTMAMLTFRSWRCAPNSNGLVVHKRWKFWCGQRLNVTSHLDCSGAPIFVWTVYGNRAFLVHLRLPVSQSQKMELSPQLQLVGPSFLLELALQFVPNGHRYLIPSAAGIRVYNSCSTRTEPNWSSIKELDIGLPKF